MIKFLKRLGNHPVVFFIFDVYVDDGEITQTIDIYYNFIGNTHILLPMSTPWVTFFEKIWVRPPVKI